MIDEALAVAAVFINHYLVSDPPPSDCDTHTHPLPWLTTGIASPYPGWG